MIRSRKYFWVLALLTACAGPNRLANLTTADPKATDRYHFYFAKRLMDFSGANALLVKARYERYEKNLNELLGSDPNTTGCKVSAGSINLGEPGSGAVALVSCTKPVPVQVDSSAFTMDGKPFYRYWLKVE